jgi:hypothetical protein
MMADGVEANPADPFERLAPDRRGFGREVVVLNLVEPFAAVHEGADRLLAQRGGVR